ncbi:MAG: AsnC family protein [Nitrososphaerota archaeon]|nr:AsnC family protein [Nitrososphaerota archaeon]MDG6968241.1 AsnC family protein [Nitrososphaerota archaeon]MDG6982915.1 AsnC family protein [Nitrososphaerota archaeon]MDG6987454.1 AsnC family protein [Nitrososphaerota archaeon]MDG7026612.1 AsnC family protein [Nitrososphaerota archaeon]
MGKQTIVARDTSARTAELVSMISEIGPDIPEIARRLDQFKESVRYRYKEKVLSKGFAVHALPNHEKLGLRRVMLLLDFNSLYATYANSILTAMNELCYVVYFEKRMFQGDFIVEASVPSEHVGEFRDLMTKLQEKGLFTSLQVYEFDWFRAVPMRAESYDFDTGRWDFDWSAGLKLTGDAGYQYSSRVKFDKDDLLILKELQTDATRSFVDIATKLKENYKKLSWHYKTHVIERGLINGYSLRWMGTSYSTILERALHRKHRYQHLALLGTHLTEMERIQLMAKSNGVPFLWNEMGGKNEYCAHFYFPTEYITEAYQYLTDAISMARDRVSVMPLDQTEALSFTVSYQLFDKRSKQWILNSSDLLDRFGGLIAKITEIGGTA